MLPGYPFRRFVALTICRFTRICFAAESRGTLARSLLLAALLICGEADNAWSAMVVIVGWDTSSLPGGANNFGPSPYAATTTDASVTSVVGLTRGSGVTTTSTGAARGWGGNGWSQTTATDGINANQFFTFGFTVQSGYSLSLSSLDLNYRRSATGPSSGELAYSINGGATYSVIDSALPFSSTSSSGSTIPEENLSGFSTLQNLVAGTAVTFRLTPYSASGPSGTFYVFDTANTTSPDLFVNGTSTVVSSGKTWNGGSGTWNTTSSNWLNSSGSATFTAGDNVIFDNTSPGTVTVTGTGVSPGTITVSSSSNYTFTGGSIGGAGSLTKSGTGILTLNSANGFTGGTNLSGGILVVGNSGALGSVGTISSSATLAIGSGATFTRPVTFATGSVLAGKGTYAPSTALTVGGASNVGTIGPGIADGTNNVGTLTIGNAVTFASGGTLNIDTNGATADSLAVTGSATVNSGTNLVFNQIVALTAGKYPLVTASIGTFSNNFTSSGTPTNYRVLMNAANNELDLIHKATIGTISATPVAAAIITGGSTGVNLTVSNSAVLNSSDLTFTASPTSNMSGSTSGTAVAQNTSTQATGLYFNGTSIGVSQTGSFSVSDANATNSGQSGSVLVNVYDHASPSVVGTTIALPDTIAGFNGAIATFGGLTISNSAGFRSDLKTIGPTTANITMTCSVGITNVSGIAAGDRDTISAGANLDGTQPVGSGALNQTFHLTYADDSTLAGASANLGAVNFAVTGNVYDHASPLAVGTSLHLPDSIRDYVGTLSSTTSTSVRNETGYRVPLKTVGVTDSEPFSINNVSNVVSGGSAAITGSVYLDGWQPIGALSRTFTLTYADDSTLDGASSNLGTMTIAVSGNVLDHAAPTLFNLTPSFGRAMKNTSVPAVTTTLGNVAEAARAGMQITSLPAGLSGANVNDVVANGGSKTLSATVSTAVTGPYAQHYSIGVSDDQGVIGWSPLTAQAFDVYGTVVDNRVVTASPVNFGLLHLGRSGSGSTTLSTTGDNNHFTAVTVSGSTSGGVTVAGGTTVFKADGASETRAVSSGALNSAGFVSSSVVLSTSGEGLNSEVPINVSVPYSAQVFSGSGVWTSSSTSSSGSLWRDHGNWTDANGVQAAPGTFEGFANTDVAIFSGSGTVTSISLSGANPGLKTLKFSNSAYTLSDGTLTLSDGTVTVSVENNKSEIASTIAGPGRLLKNGSGILVLSGSNTYKGGTVVEAGTLTLAAAGALPDGMALTVGAGATLIFDPTRAGGSPVSLSAAQGAVAVPEPDTLALLAGGASGLACFGLRRWRQSASFRN